MSLTTPTTQQTADNITAAIAGTIGQTIPLLPKSFTRAMAKATAGVFMLVFKYAGFSLQQMFVGEATIDETVINGKTIRPLIELGRRVGVPDPDAGLRAQLTIQITVLNQVGNLDVNAQLVRTETGVLYLTQTAVALDAPTKLVDMQANSDQDGNGGVGAVGNLEVGDEVFFASPPANVADKATVAAVVTTGADAEPTDTYRASVAQRSSERPQGGAYADYRTWGEAVAGIARIFPYTGDTPGEVDVYVEATVASSGDADGVPTQAQLDSVSIAIEQNTSGLAENRPAGAAVNTLEISRQPFDVEVSGLIASDPVTAQATITAAVDELLRSREPFIVGLSMLPRTDRITASSVAGIAGDAADAEGASISSVTLNVAGSPVTAWTLVGGQRAKLGTINFI